MKVTHLKRLGLSGAWTRQRIEWSNHKTLIIRCDYENVWSFGLAFSCDTTILKVDSNGLEGSHGVRRATTIQNHDLVLSIEIRIEDFERKSNRFLCSKRRAIWWNQSSHVFRCLRKAACSIRIQTIFGFSMSSEVFIAHWKGQCHAVESGVETVTRFMCSPVRRQSLQSKGSRPFQVEKDGIF